MMDITSQCLLRSSQEPSKCLFIISTSLLGPSFIVESYRWHVGGPCDFSVTPVPIGLGFGTALGFGLGLGGLDLGLGLDNWDDCILRVQFSK